jgi:hypothetical protein
MKNTLKKHMGRFMIAAAVAIFGLVALVPPSSASAGTVTGLYEIRNTTGGRCLSVLGGMNANPSSAYMTVQGCISSPFQYMQFERIYYDQNGTAWFEIHPKAYVTKCLGLVYEQSWSNGVAFQMGTCNGSSAQKFTLDIVDVLSDGNVRAKIKNKLAGKCMQANSPWADFDYVVQWNCSELQGGAYTTWQFKWLAQG